MQDYKFSFQLGPMKFYGNDEQEILDAIGHYYTEKDVYINIEQYRSLVKKGKKPVELKIGDMRSNYGPAKQGKQFSEIISGAKAIIKNEFGLTVDQSEIERRAIICTSCPLVSEVSNCMTCGAAKTIAKWLSKAKKELLGDRQGKQFQIPNLLENKYCDHCGCSLFVMLPSEMSNFKEENSASRPMHCWLNPKSPNYVAS